MKKLTLILSLLALPLFVKADPLIQVLSNVSFGAIMPAQGQCFLDYDTELTTSFSGAYICQNGHGQAGHIRITHTPNTLLTIRINQRLETDGDGIRYLPAGILSNDLGDEVLQSNYSHIIDTEASGEINIHLGGTLFITKQLGTQQLFQVEVLNGIEVTE